MPKNTKKSFIGIIPARFASSRFPGKPLVDIFGKPMIQRVYEQVIKTFKTVYVATDDDRIFNTVLAFGGKAVMTLSTHNSGTDRLAEAIEKIHILEKNNFDIIVNIQGDEPFIKPEQLQQIKNCFDKTDTQIATLVKIITDPGDIFNPNIPKVIINKDKEALIFSRSSIPHVRGHDRNNWIQKHKFYKHIGIYAYTYPVLKEITKLEPSTLEIAESLEQLRWLENNYKIKVEITNFESFAVDTPQDLEKLKMNKIENK